MTEKNEERAKMVKAIGLGKLFLWPEAERVQTYPEALANLAAGRRYTRAEIGLDIFGLVHQPDGSGKFVRGNQIENCFGWEPAAAEKVSLRGINCLRQVGPDQFVATEAALAIGRGYRTDEAEAAWLLPLARQIAQFEVRTRLLLYLLGDGGWSLTFADPEFFAYPSAKAILTHDDEAAEAAETIALFQNQSAAFNPLLQQHRHVALGPWWVAELAEGGYEVSPDFHFEGIRGGPPSTNKLNSNIKSSLFLLHYLGVLESCSGRWRVSAPQAMAVLGEAIARDFVDLNSVQAETAGLAILKALAQDLQDEAGLIIVSRLARSWAGRHDLAPHEAEAAFDQFIRAQLYEGAIRITTRHPGQLRHGRGLFGDANARKIKLEFLR